MEARAALLPEKAPDRRIAAGSNAANRLIREFPGSRFRRAAFGLRGRALFLTGRLKAALECYFAAQDMESVETVGKALGYTPPGLRARLLAGYLVRLAEAKTFRD